MPTYLAWNTNEGRRTCAWGGAIDGSVFDAELRAIQEAESTEMAFGGVPITADFHLLFSVLKEMRVVTIAATNYLTAQILQAVLRHKDCKIEVLDIIGDPLCTRAELAFVLYLNGSIRNIRFDSADVGYAASCNKTIEAVAVHDFTSSLAMEDADMWTEILRMRTLCCVRCRRVPAVVTRAWPNCVVESDGTIHKQPVARGWGPVLV